MKLKFTLAFILASVLAIGLIYYLFEPRIPISAAYYSVEEPKERVSVQASQFGDYPRDTIEIDGKAYKLHSITYRAKLLVTGEKVIK